MGTNNQLCPCSQLDWSEVDQTAEHHPNCTASELIRVSFNKGISYISLPAAELDRLTDEGVEFWLHPEGELERVTDELIILPLELKDPHELNGLKPLTYQWSVPEVAEANTVETSLAYWRFGESAGFWLDVVPEDYPGAVPFDGTADAIDFANDKIVVCEPIKMPSESDETVAMRFHLTPSQLETLERALAVFMSAAGLPAKKLSSPQHQSRALVWFCQHYLDSMEGKK